MAEPYKHSYKVNLNHTLIRRDAGHLATHDSKANRFCAELHRDGIAVDVSGYTVTGYFIRPDDETVHCPGTVDGSTVYVDLLPGCYLYDGAFEFSLKIKLGDEELTVLLCNGTIERSRSDATASGGETIITVHNAQMLGGKAPEYYLQPRNLLDNSDFRVAQAGYGAYHGNSKYACDRWLDTYGFGVFGYEEGYGLYVAKGDNHAYLEQRLEYPERLTGKSCTLAMKLSDGNVYTCNGVMVGNNELVARFSGANWELDLRGDRVQFVVTDGYVYVQWMALYAGTYTAETLPPYVPKGYAAELAECQRYAYITGSGNWLTGLRVGGHGLVVPLEIPVSMRSRPTVDGVFQAYVSGTEWDSIELATVGYDASTGYVHNIVFTVPDTLAVHDCCIVSGIVGLFADL